MTQPTPGSGHRLTPFERRLVKALYQERLAVCRASGSKATPYGTNTEADCDEMGVIGEIAFAALFNVYPDFTTQPRKGGCDCLYRGEPVDVKTCKFGKTDLIIHPRKVGLYEGWFALMALAHPEDRLYGAIFWGFMHSRQAFADEYFNHHLPEAAYCIPKHLLLPDIAKDENCEYDDEAPAWPEHQRQAEGTFGDF